MTELQRPPRELRRYAHLDPADGMCLMEYVSVVAGVPFSDSPAGVNPLLSALARAVNDATSDQGRADLIGLAEALAAKGYVSAPELEDRVEALCLDAIRTASAPGSRAERRARRRQSHLLRHRSVRRGALRWIRQNGTSRRTVEAAVRTLSRLPQAEADRALHRLLADCIGVVRARGDHRMVSV
jgi:hypothetical protein